MTEHRPTAYLPLNSQQSETCRECDEPWPCPPSRVAAAPSRLTPMSDVAEHLARRFHEAYERLAPQYGYETREASAKPWVDVPENNRALMVAVCAELLDLDPGDTFPAPDGPLPPVPYYPAMQARADAATEGPWEVAEEIDGMHGGRRTVVRAGRSSASSGVGRRVVTVGQTRRHHDAPGVAEANIEFIAHARTDVPALLRELRLCEQSLAYHTQLSFSHGFEVARLAPFEITARGWRKHAEQLEARLRVIQGLHRRVCPDGVIITCLHCWKLADEAVAWPCATARALGDHTIPASVGREPTMSQDDCHCMEVVHLGDARCWRCGRELTTTAFAELRKHLVAAHSDGMAIAHTDAAALAAHWHEHAGPGTIRNHDRDDLSWDEGRYNAVLAELAEDQ